MSCRSALPTHAWPLLGVISLAIILANGCAKPSDVNTRAAAAQSPPGVSARRLTFVQLTDPHLFDAGEDRHGEGIEEEALDNRAAFHWAMLEINRLVLAEARPIDFVVITGDFGLANVTLPPSAHGVKDCDCPKRQKAREGPVPPVSLESAAAEVARDLGALVVKRVLLVPGHSDLCDQSPLDLHRWAEFVLALRGAIKATPGVYARPEVIDLSYSLERLYAKNDPRVRSLFADGSHPDPPPAAPPAFNGIAVLGLDSAYFQPHANAAIQTAADIESLAELTDLSRWIQSGGSYVLFTHIPDVMDPSRPPESTSTSVKSTADKASAWKLPPAARAVWRSDILGRSEVMAIFAGHWHAGKRDLYPQNFAAPKPDAVTSTKTWVAPPLGAALQSTLPPTQTARGMLLVSVTGAGALRTTIDARTVAPMPVWFSTLDRIAAADGDDKLAQARAAERDANWDEAAKQYQQALTAKDSRVRASALLGYEAARGVTRTWWWQLGAYFPPVRWAVTHPRRTLWFPLIVLALLGAFAFLRKLRFLFVPRLIALLLTPKYRGTARLRATGKMTADAPADEFNAQILAAQEEVRTRLMSEQESWMAGHVQLLAPASISFDTLVSSVPNVRDVKVSDWLKFVVQLAQAFQWNVDSGLAVFPPAAAPPATAPGAGPAPLPPGGELSAYAVLQWAWLTKNSWRRKVLINNHSAVHELARELAELLVGEAFVK